MNDGLKAASAVLIADMKQSEAAAEALGSALGPELRDKIGSAKLDSFIADLRRAGLTFEEITADAEMFGSSLKELDNASGSVKNVEGSLNRMRGEADQSRSVLANMVGNSVQDLGQLGGVAGSAGVMLGQLGEYAADGNIKLAQLANFAVPMAALAITTAALGSALGEVKAADAFDASEVQAFAAALREGRDVTVDLVDRLTQAGKIEYHGLFSEFTGDDLMKKMAALGVTVEQFAQASVGGADAAGKMRDILLEQGATFQDANAIYDAAIERHTNLTNATKFNDQWQKVFSKDVSISGSMMGEAARQGNLLADAIHRVTMGFSINGSMAGEGARNGSRPNLYAQYLQSQAESTKVAGKAAKETVKKTAEELARERDALNATKFEFGGMSEAAYRKYLNSRLSHLKKYSADWVAIKRDLMALDAEDAKSAQAIADAKEKAAKDAAKAAEDEAAARKKAADEAQAAEEAERNRLAQRSIVAANVAGATYNYINTAADPYAVISAIRRYEQQNGTAWRA